MTFFINKEQKKKPNTEDLIHTHISSEITDLNEVMEDKIKGLTTRNEFENHTHDELDFSPEFLDSLKGDKGDDGHVVWITKDANVVAHRDDNYFPASVILASYKRVGNQEESPYPLDYNISYRVLGLGESIAYRTITQEPYAIVPVGMMDSRDIDIVTIEVTDNGKLIEIIRIPVVRNGQKGDDGESFTFNDLTVNQIEMLRGSKGDSGLVHVNTGGQLKVWTGSVALGSDGIWQIDYTTAKFTEVYSVIPIAQHPQDSAAETTIAASLTSFDNTSAKGKSHKGTSAGLLAAMSNLWANKDKTTIYVTVIGK